MWKILSRAGEAVGTGSEVSRTAPSVSGEAVRGGRAGSGPEVPALTPASDGGQSTTRSRTARRGGTPATASPTGCHEGRRRSLLTPQGCRRATVLTTLRVTLSKNVDRHVF